MTQQLDIGVVGSGFIAQNRHLPIWTELENVQIKGVSDVDSSKVNEACDKYDIPNGFSTMDEMLESIDIDIIDICTPPETHTQLCSDAMEHGCHVLTEKPLAVTSDEAEQLVQKSNKTGMKLCTVHQKLFYPPVMQVRRAVENGKIGDIGGVNVTFSTPASKFLQNKESWIHDAEGGLLEETGPHTIYLCQVLIGSIQDVNVSARKITDVPWADWDDFTVELQGEDASATIRIIHHSNFRAEELDVWGTSGRYKIDLQAMHAHRFKRETLDTKDLVTSTLREATSQAGSVVTNGFKSVMGQFEYGHEVILAEFAESVRNGTESPVTVEEACETVKTLEEAISDLNN